MEKEFWIKKWQENNIGFHEITVNPLLEKHFHKLSLNKGSRIFLPLCGKTRDIAWLLAKGHRIVGVELVETAIIQLFSELGIKPQTYKTGKLTLYTADDIDIFVGDIFELSNENLGPVDAVYDRAALVALSDNVRNKYCTHIQNITVSAPQLIICYEYDQSLTTKPPFSIPEQELSQYYSNSYDLNLLERNFLPNGFNGKFPAKECAWFLQKKS